MTHGEKLLKHATVAVSLAAGQTLARKPDRQLSLAVWACGSVTRYGVTR